MGKTKKGKKGNVEDTEDGVTDTLVKSDGDLEEERVEGLPLVSSRKKGKQKKHLDAMYDEGAKDKDDDEEDYNDEEKQCLRTKCTLSRFQILAGMKEDSDVDDPDEDVDDPDVDGRGSISPVPETSHIPVCRVSRPKKKQKKKVSAKTAEEDDVDAILASLDEPKEVKRGKKTRRNDADEKSQIRHQKDEASVELAEHAPHVVTVDDHDSDEYSRKRRKKKKKNAVEDTMGADMEEVVMGQQDGDDDDGEELTTVVGAVMMAVQKNKEKRQPDMLKKVQNKQPENIPEESNTCQVPSVTCADGDPTQHTINPPSVADGGEVESKKKKKKNKGKDEKEEKEGKKPKTKAHVARIKAEMARLKEEEEARVRAEEEAERLEEERLCKLEEEKRIAEEIKLRKKQKKKEREERAKQEGRYLTDRQKLEKKRAEQMLRSIQELGGVVPTKSDVPSRRPFYGKKKKEMRLKDECSKTTDPEEVVLAADIMEGEVEEVAVKLEEIGEIVKDAWDAETDEENDDVDRDADEFNVVMSKSEDIQNSGDEVDATSDAVSERGEDGIGTSEEESESSESEDDRSPTDRGHDKVLARQNEAMARVSMDILRAPVVCVLGHVDTGKTKILDKLRRTNVQDGEAGGITQQIGATNVPRESILEKTKMCADFQRDNMKLPGLLIIDTPGHESFSNLRMRGSSLCDIAILVVDIMHGVEAQTRESIGLLKARKTPFVIALNKVDRLYEWKSRPQSDIAETVSCQASVTRDAFDRGVMETVNSLQSEGLNTKLFYENDNPREYVSLVPTSAHTGDGIGNLIALICTLTQTMLTKRIAYCDELQATVMEVKALPGKGTTVDVILVNGQLIEGQVIVLAGTEGPIVTSIRCLLIPQPMTELRVKANDYLQPKVAKAAMGVKICARDLEKALAGLQLYVAHDRDEIEYYKIEADRGLDDTLQGIRLSDRGVYVQASTLGSLEALLEYLRSSKVKYAGINIGPVHKKDVMKASIMLEHDPQFAVILAFDVEVKRDVQDLADSCHVTIFTANIIYHLFDNFTAYRQDLLKTKQEQFRSLAVFPCRLRIMPDFIFNSRDPIVMGVVILDGFVREGTPLCVPTKEFVEIGRVASIEVNHKSVEVGKAGMEVCIKVVPAPGDAPKLFGRHFEASDVLVSKISRESIDAVKNYFRKDMSKTDWILIMELKKLFQIM